MLKQPLFHLSVVAASLVLMLPMPTKAEELSEKIETRCASYDLDALSALKQSKGDQQKLQNIVDVYMSVRGEVCGFERSYEYCAALKYPSCVLVVNQRKKMK